MFNRWIYYFLYSLMMVVPATPGMSQDVQRHAWEVDLSINRYELDDDENSLRGNSVLFRIGRGWIGDRWLFGGTVDIVMGPFEEIRDERVRTDFFGTGLSAYSAYSLNGPLRNGDGSWGVMTGLSYSDIVGRSVQNGKLSEDNTIITNLTMRSTSFMVSAGIFKAWLVGARLEGNTPDLLLTRVEGYVISLNAGYPVQSSYSVKYDVRDHGETGPTGPVRSMKERGSLRGYTVFASISALLGY